MTPQLVEGYRRCRRLTREYGTTYYWGAVLLPKPQRKHVYAVYALCRLADDIIDLPDTTDPAVLDAQLTAFEESFRTALVERGSDDPTMAFAISRLTDAGYLNTSPIGIFRQVERPTYDDAARQQVAAARDDDTADRAARLTALIGGGDTWTIL